MVNLTTAQGEVSDLQIQGGPSSTPSSNPSVKAAIGLQGGATFTNVHDVGFQYVNGYCYEFPGPAGGTAVHSMIGRLWAFKCTGGIHLQGASAQSWNGQFQLDGVEMGQMSGDGLFLEDIQDISVTGYNCSVVGEAGGIGQTTIAAGAKWASVPQAGIRGARTPPPPAPRPGDVETVDGVEMGQMSGDGLFLEDIQDISVTGYNCSVVGEAGGIGQTTIAAGSNGASLPQASISVASTTPLPAAGTVYVTTAAGPQLVTYTGTSGGNTLTGCLGGTGAMSTGGLVGTGAHALHVKGNCSAVRIGNPDLGQFPNTGGNLPTAPTVLIEDSLNGAPNDVTLLPGVVQQGGQPGNILLQTPQGGSMSRVHVYTRLVQSQGHGAQVTAAGFDIAFYDAPFSGNGQAAGTFDEIAWTGTASGKVKRCYFATAQGAAGGGQVTAAGHFTGGQVEFDDNETGGAGFTVANMFTNSPKFAPPN